MSGPLRRALLLGALMLGLAWPAWAGGLLERRSHSAQIGPGRYVLSVYANGAQAWLHLQPDGTGEEQLFDAATGTRLRELPEGFATARRLGFVAPREPQQGSAAWRTAYLQGLGCQRHSHGCTVVDDDPLLVFASFVPEQRALAWELIDTRALMQRALDLFAGRATAAGDEFEPAERQLLEAAVEGSELRPQLQDALESVDSMQRLQALQASMRQLDLCNWRVFTCADRDGRVLDLRRAVERQRIRVYAVALGQALAARPDAASRGAFVEFVRTIAAPPYPIGSAVAQAVQAFQRLTPPERSVLVQTLDAYKGPEQETLRCTALWITQRSCPASALAAQPPADKVARGPAPPRHPAIPPAPPLLLAIPEEANRLSQLSNQDRLRQLDMKENTGVLTRDAAAVSWLVFTARDPARADSGEYAFTAHLAEGAPVPLKAGNYRVRLDLQLSYVREDVCQGFFHCLMSGSKRVPKSSARTVSIELTSKNGWRTSGNVSFGHLRPMTADGGTLYKSELREVRLVVNGAQWSQQM